MRSLFVRIWLSFWLVMALTLGGAAAVTFALALKRAQETDRIAPAALAASAGAVLAKQGRDGLNGWLVGEVHAQPELRIYFVDPEGRELLSRTIRGRPLTGPQGEVVPRITAADGVVYRVLVRRTGDVVFDLWNIFLQPWTLLLLSLSVSGAGCALLAHHLTRPVVRLRSGVRAIAAGRLDTRMGDDIAARRDELGGLARDFDQMAADLRALIASKEELLRDVSHELRSPLARLRVAAGLARRGAPARSTAAFDRIDREVERLDAQIGQILTFSRLGAGPAPARELVDLTGLMEETVEDARIEAADAGKTVSLDLAEPATAVGDRTMLRSAIENVLRNAVRFAPVGSTVAVRLSRSAGWALIEVADSGPGMDEADLIPVFEPFYRTATSNGVGLGLAITARVLALHAGSAAAANRASGGLSVVMRLPATADFDPAADFA